MLLQREAVKKLERKFIKNILVYDQKLPLGAAFFFVHFAKDVHILVHCVSPNKHPALLNCNSRME